MRQLAFTIVVVIELVFLALAIDGVFGGLWGLSPNPLFDLLYGWRGPAGELERRFYWVTAALLPLIHWGLALSIARRHRAIVLKTTSSESLILYQSAIVQYVGNALGEIPEVLAYRAKVKQAGGTGLSMSISVTLKPVNNIPSIQERIENTVRRQLIDVLGIAKIHKITVIVKDFGVLERHANATPPAQQIAIQARPESPSEPEGGGEIRLSRERPAAEETALRPQEIRLAPPPEPIEVIQTPANLASAGEEDGSSPRA